MSAAGTKGRNQHIQAKADRRAKEGRDAWREQLRISQLMKRLVDCGEGRISLNPTQIKALEVVVDRLVPRLSATEVAEVNDLDSLSREEILERIRALLAADPSLLAELVALNARKQTVPPSAVVVDTERATGAS